MKTRKFQTLREARAFHKANSSKWGWNVRKVPNAKKWKYFVGTDFEWLNLN